MTKNNATSRTVVIRRIIIGVIIGTAIVVGALAIWNRRGGNDVGEDLKYDVSQYMKTDPALILYREVADGSFDTGFTKAVAITVSPNGDVHVAGDKAVRVFDLRGQQLTELPLPEAPRALCVHEDGWMCVAFKSSARIYRAGGVTFDLDIPPDAVLTAVAVRADDIYFADAASRTVLHYYKLDPQPKISHDDAPDGLAGFNVPSPYFDLVVEDGDDGKGVLRVTDPGRHRIVTMTRDGKHIAAWKRKRSMRIEDFCGCCNPINIALTPEGNIVTAEKGLARVKLYDTAGEFLGVVAGVESFPGHDPAAISGDVGAVLDVAVDKQGRVLVLDCRTAKVRVFERIKATQK